jgi:hypothetical protein
MRWIALAIALTTAGCWTPIDRVEVDGSPPMEAPLRTTAQHDSVMEGRAWPYVLRLSHPSGGELLYFGSWHTRDPADPQIEAMRDAWRGARPTIALTENTGGWAIGGLDGGIRTLGEFAVPIHEAREHDIPVRSLEPSWEAELADASAAFPVEDLLVFYTLRVFLSERGDRSGEALDDLADHLLGKRGSRPGFQGVIGDLAAFDSVWAANFADAPGDWRSLPPEAVWPNDEGHRLQRISTVVNRSRDRHMVRVILHYLERGERVYAVAGGSHVVIQEPALRAAAAGG